MKRKWQRNIVKCIYVVFLVVIFLGACALWGYHVVSHWQTTERVETERETTVEAVHSMFWFKSSLMFYPFMQKNINAYRTEKDSGTYVIPGLNATRTMRAGTDDVCTNMVPQSVCVVEDYLLIGAYCKTKTHYSVIYVIDKNTHEYLKTIVLPGRHHVGGIAYDSIHQRIWVSCYKERAQANSFSLRQLEVYDYDFSKRAIRFTDENDLYSIPKDSCMTYYNGYLYIGYFQVSNDSVLQKFAIAEDGTLVKENSSRYTQQYGTGLPREIVVPVNVSLISSKIQGIAFTEYRMYLTQSYGVTQSKLAKFEILTDDVENPIYTNDKAINIITMPQKLEQIAVDGDDMYVIFESAGYAYRYYSYPSIDRVIKLKVDDVGDYKGSR